MVPGPSAASSTADRVPTTDVSISDRMLPRTQAAFQWVRHAATAKLSCRKDAVNNTPL